jgi:hypothetical protein
MLDPRRTAFRPDIAADFLKGIVKADCYVSGQRMLVSTPTAPLKNRPDRICSMSAELIKGEIFTVYDEKDSWCWGQSQEDDYVGWVLSANLSADVPDFDSNPNYRVCVLATHIYAEPDIRSPCIDWVPLLGKVCVTDNNIKAKGMNFPFCAVERGYIPIQHLLALDAFSAEEKKKDFVSIAELFTGTPYLWGGETVRGIDCSALVQNSLLACGYFCPRDSDMQQGELGVEKDPNAAMARGDLVFWKGHVGVMCDSETILHATAHSMVVVRESFDTVVRRHASLHDVGDVCQIRRLPD